MLFKLLVKNFTLIEELKLDFSSGFNILSGETGAGKSVVMGALGLLLGDRASANQVREGESQAFLEAIFTPDNEAQFTRINKMLENGGIDTVEPDGVLIIARELFSGGRSVGRINGRSVPVSFLKELGSLLVDLHGQHQHQSLLHRERHLDILDVFGGDKLRDVREKVAHIWRKRRNIKKQLESSGLDVRERERLLDLLIFQIKEIQDAALSPEEEEDLLDRQRVMVNSESIVNGISAALHIITGGGGKGGYNTEYESYEALDGDKSLQDEAFRARQEVMGAANFDDSLKPVLELMDGVSAQLEEAVAELRVYLDGVEFEPVELERIQDRLEQIRGLKRKYGDTVTDVIQFSSKAEEEYNRLKDSEELAGKMEKELLEMDEELIGFCSVLSMEREKAAGLLEDRLHEVLPHLALEKARFSVSFSEVEPGERGSDRVEFLFSANPGESLKPLSDIISGGEMSRVMLAIKTVLAGFDQVPTMIFDEVDTGIGGVVIQRVAEKLAYLAQKHQVVVVTHSPQIAVMASTHFYLYKEEIEGRTLTRARKLGEEDRKHELARMLDGGPDPVSLQHVEAMIQRARTKQ